MVTHVFKWKTASGTPVTVPVQACPFCGGDPKLVVRAGRSYSAIQCSNEFWRGKVVCKCGVSTKELSNPRKLEALWNRRAVPAEGAK